MVQEKGHSCNRIVLSGIAFLVVFHKIWTLPYRSIYKWGPFSHRIHKECLRCAMNLLFPCCSWSLKSLFSLSILFKFLNWNITYLNNTTYFSFYYLVFLSPTLLFSINFISKNIIFLWKPTNCFTLHKIALKIH